MRGILQSLHFLQWITLLRRAKYEDVWIHRNTYVPHGIYMDRMIPLVSHLVAISVCCYGYPSDESILCILDDWNTIVSVRPRSSSPWLERQRGLVWMLSRVSDDRLGLCYLRFSTRHETSACGGTVLLANLHFLRRERLRHSFVRGLISVVTILTRVDG